MGFEALLGNSRLKENLKNSLKNNHISHFYLISGPAGSGRHTLARLLAAAILCKDPDRPCLRCPACRKVMASSHPDFITVDDPEHKNVAVKIVREAREDMFIRPNESDYKIYLFPQELGIEGQNALLKILEEPPAYGVFMLLTDNPEKLLPTVRSRCTELALAALPDNVLRSALLREFPQAEGDAISAAISRSGGYLGRARELLKGGNALMPQTEGFLQSFASKNSLGLVQTLAPMEKWKRDQLIPVLEQWIACLEEALCCRSGMRALHPLTRAVAERRTPQEMLQAVLHLKKAVEYAAGNVSPGAICGALAWQLR